MAEAEFRAQLSAISDRVVALERQMHTVADQGNTLRADLNGCVNNYGATIQSNIAYSNNTTTMITAFLDQLDKKNSQGGVGGLNHAAAKNIDTKPWSGVDDKAQAWKEFKRSTIGWCECLVPGAKEVLDVAESTDIGDAMDFSKTAMDDSIRDKLNHALYWRLSTRTTGSASGYIQGVPWNMGLSAWQELCAYAAPRSVSDRQAVYAKLMDPKEASSVSTMATELAAWERDMAEFETRFEKLREDEKVSAAKKIVPKEIFRNRLIGMKLDSYDELRRVIRAIGLDRALAVREEQAKKTPRATQKSDPMDIDTLAKQHSEGDISTEDFLMAVGTWSNERQKGQAQKQGDRASYGPVKRQQGTQNQTTAGNWTMKGEKGGGKGKDRDAKGKGKGKGKRCYNCDGIGHIARECPSEKGAGKGMNEMRDGEPEEDSQYVNEDADWFQDDEDSEKTMMTLGLKEADHINKGISAVDDPKQKGDILAMTKVMGGKRYMKVEGTLDSGCVDHVFPQNMLEEIAMKPSEMSKARGSYITATSQPVPNLGQKTLNCKLNEGYERRMIVQVANIGKPLISASRLNDTGHSVHLHPNAPKVTNLKTGEETKLRRVGKTFLMDIWVELPATPEHKPKTQHGQQHRQNGTPFKRR